MRQVNIETLFWGQFDLMCSCLGVSTHLYVMLSSSNHMFVDNDLLQNLSWVNSCEKSACVSFTNIDVLNSNEKTF